MPNPTSPNGFINGVMAAWNADFSGSNNPLVSNGLAADKQLWVGSTTPNANNTNVNVLTLTAGSGISISQAATTLTISSTDGAMYAYTATAVSYQVLITDRIIGVTSNAAARTITMPNSGMIAGQYWTIKDEAGTAQSSNNITISGNGANIDGSSTYVININYGSVTIYWNGSNFFVI